MSGTYRAPGSASVLVTFFDDYAAQHKSEQELSLEQLARVIEQASAARKEQLRWLKLAKFADRRSVPGNSLRNNGNVVEIFGVEADYDLEEMGLEDAADLLSRAGVAALLYPSPSYTISAPRWRVLCPTSRPYPPGDRDKFMGRLAGLFRNVFSRESWTLSQSYYFGRVSNPDHHCVVLRGACIDACHWLDAMAVPPPERREVGERPALTQRAGDISEPRIRGVIEALLGNIRAAPDGEKHHRLRDNCRMIGGYLHLIPGWTVDDATAAAVDALPSADDWEAAWRTARWALESGAAAPIDLPDRPVPGMPPMPPPWDEIPPQHQPPAPLDRPHPGNGKDYGGRPPELPPPHLPPPPTPLGDAPMRGVDPTEDGVALAFAHLQAGRRVYDHSRQRWSLWTGLRWQLDEREVVFTEGRSLVRAVRNGLPDDLKELARIKFSTAVEKGAKADPRLAVDQSVWDRDPWLLGTPAGVVNLHTGQLRPPSSDLYISRHAGVAPAPEGTPCPLWTAFLHDATGGDRELQTFLQRLFGYALTGDVSEEVVVFFYGPGGNGKGTVLTVLNGVLGEYALTVPIAFFTASSRLNMEYYRAELANARLMSASETEAQANWAEQELKDISGNDALQTGRHPYGRPFQFRSQAKVLIVGNHAPKLKSRSPAMERRLRIVPFDHVPSTPDPHLKDKLRDEYPAILAWAIAGCLDWQRHRLGVPAAVKAASAQYFEAQDAFARWLDERCILDRTLNLAPGILLGNFNSWAKSNGEDTMTSNAFAELIDRTSGLSRERTKHGRYVRGIGLKAQDTRFED